MCKISNLVDGISDSGLRTVEQLSYFKLFFKNQGSSVISLSDVRKEYEKMLRHLKVMSKGTHREAGLGLFEADYQKIKVTEKGNNLIKVMLNEG